MELRADNSPPLGLQGAGGTIAAEDAQGPLDVRWGVNLSARDTAKLFRSSSRGKRHP